MDFIKGKVKKVQSIKEIINKKFNTNFDFLQIRYRINKLLALSYGEADSDALRFVELCQKKKDEGQAFFEYQICQNNKFKSAIYVSNVMQTYAEFFCDFVLVDTTYRRNRFNLPLVNVVGVNNLGKTIMLAFGMLNNETISSYTWFFRMLKHCWQKNPKVFISDEDESIHQGRSQYFFV